MIGSTGQAGKAGVAGVIDFGSHTSVRLGQADEFVSQYSSKPHVSAGNLEIGIADPDQVDLKPNLALPGLRRGQVAFELDRRAIIVDASHGFRGLRRIFIRDNLRIIGNSLQFSQVLTFAGGYDGL
jgi:hypothetical protein